MSQTASRSHVSPGRPNIKKTAETAPSGATAKTAGVLNGRWIPQRIKFRCWILRDGNPPDTPKPALNRKIFSL
jgi:hypothetical protein